MNSSLTHSQLRTDIWERTVCAMLCIQLCWVTSMSPAVPKLQHCCLLATVLLPKTVPTITNIYSLSIPISNAVNNSEVANVFLSNIPGASVYGTTLRYLLWVLNWKTRYKEKLCWKKIFQSIQSPLFWFHLCASSRKSGSNTYTPFLEKKSSVLRTTALG